MKNLPTFRQFRVQPVDRPDGPPDKLAIVDPQVDIRKTIPARMDKTPVIQAMEYLASIGITIHAVAPAIRQQEWRLLSRDFETPLR